MTLEYGAETRIVLGQTYRITVDYCPEIGAPDRDDVVTVIFPPEDGRDPIMPTAAMTESNDHGKLSQMASRHLVSLEDRRVSFRAFARWLHAVHKVRGLHIVWEESHGTQSRIGSVGYADWAGFKICRPEGYGVAFVESAIADENLSDGADVDAVVHDSLEEYNAYLSGDVFGYNVEHVTTGDLVGSCWGYYGIDREGEYVASEIESLLLADAADRNIRDQASALEAAVEAERVARVAEDNAAAVRRYNRDALAAFRDWMDTNLPGMREDYKPAIMNALNELGVRFERPA